MVRLEDAVVKHDKIKPHAIAFLFTLLIAAALIAAGIGIPKGNASPLNNNADKSANESESPETNPEMDVNSSVTTTIPSSEYFEDPVTLGLDSYGSMEKA